MKTAVKNVFNKLGIEVARIHEPPPPNEDPYKDYPAESLENRRFYNVGAGTFYHEYWTNIDYSTEYYTQYQKYPFLSYDLMKLEPLPLESETGEIFYTSHTIEHVSDAAVKNLLKEAYRILKPGGAMRLTTPDALLGYRAYKRNDRNFWCWIKDYTEPGSWERFYTKPLSEASNHQLYLHQYASQLCEIDADQSPSKKYSDEEISKIVSENSLEDGLKFFSDQCVYNPEHPENHINWWTEGKLISFLEEAGFTDCYKSGYGQSAFAPLRDTNLFDRTYPSISLYIEAIKK